MPSKSPSDWDLKQLNFYKVEVKTIPIKPLKKFRFPQNLAEFVETQEKENIVNKAADSASYSLLSKLDFIKEHKYESSVNTYVHALLVALGYERCNHMAQIQMHLPLDVSIKYEENNKSKKTGVTNGQADLVLLDFEGFIRLVVEDKRTKKQLPEHSAQLCAYLIAAFDYNNTVRKKMNLPPLSDCEMYGILHTRSLPAFYKMTVTEKLVEAVRSGKAEDQVTKNIKMLEYSPPKSPGGMTDQPNRATLLTIYDDFRRHVFSAKVLAKVKFNNP